MSETDAPPPPPELRAPIRMWREARQLLVNICGFLGHPSDLARAGAVARKLHTLYASWLRVAEAVMRHLLMIEAAALGAPPLVRRSPKREAGAVRVRKPMNLFSDEPEDWRVSFRCRVRSVVDTHANAVLRSSGPAVRSACVSPTEPTRPTWPLAARYAAVLRVFNDPISYARRLARRLRARPQLAQSLLRAPPEYVHRIDRAEAIRDAAERAWPRRHDSS